VSHRTSARIVAATAIVLGLALMGCAGPGSPAGDGPAPTDDADHFTGFLDVGGHQLWATCSGSGSPTIILEGGDESDHTTWLNIYPRLKEQTHVCMYDRLGLGKSDDAMGCRVLADLNGDLAGVLDGLGEEGPFILVGASGGGYLVAGFAMAHPDEVAGIVTLDTMHAIDTSLAPAELLEDLKCDAPNNIEHRDYVAVEHAAWDDRHLVGDIPMTVITNDYGDAWENEEERNSISDQQGWFELSPQAKQVIVTSGHDMTYNESDLVVDEVLAVLEAARAS
jgi:pimeloyl-ACP methyl ester carboxylesterase